jgi:hypothetical protein
MTGEVEQLFAVSKPAVSHELIRSSYDNALERCARLASYGTCTMVWDDSGVARRQDKLAADDLTEFAIHSRRLIENSNLRTFAQNVSVPLLKIQVGHIETRYERQGENINFWSILNLIIHHDVLKIIRHHYDAALVFNQRIPISTILDDPSEISFPPKLLIKSERRKPVIVDIGEMAKIFSKNILVVVVDFWTDEGLHLEGEDWW